MEETTLKNKVLVFGGSHHNTLGVIRSLGEKNIHSYVILVNDKSDNSFVLKSKYVKKGWILKTYEIAIQFIIDNFSLESEKTVLIATSDLASSFIDKNYDNLINNFLFPNCNISGEMNKIMNKEVMNLIALKSGFNVAKTWLVDKYSDTSEFDYPCITKPLNSINGSKEDIRICHNNLEIKRFINNIKENVKILAQKYIEKEFEYQLIGCSINGGNQIIIPGYTKIIRSSETTNTGFLQYLPINNLVYNHKACEKFIKECQYSGLFSLEFLRGKDGLDYFLEINFRNDGNAYVVTAAGMNLPYIWVKASTCHYIDDETNKEIRTIFLMPELVDIFQVLSAKISIIEWIKDILRTDSFLYYNRKDKKPFYYESFRIIKLLLRKLPKYIVNKGKI